MTLDRTRLNVAFRRHERRWHTNLYVYPVISRRSHGVSIGVNLNPDKACNFDCVYCQVDRAVPPVTRKVDLAVLESELNDTLDAARSGVLFEEAPFNLLPPDHRLVRDIAFSGDGEPTTCPQFVEAVQAAARARLAPGLTDTKLVLITDAAYLAKPRVRDGLKVLDEHNGEIWAKLDAGTEAYFTLIDRPNVTLKTVLSNILDAARARPVVIQTLWMRVNGAPPPAGEVDAYCARLNELLAAGGRLKALQLYTIARRPAEGFVTALTDIELDQIATRVRAAVDVAVETFYAA